MLNHLLEERRRRRRRRKEKEEDEGGFGEVELDWWRRGFGFCCFFSTKSVCKNLGLPTSGSTASTETKSMERTFLTEGEVTHLELTTQTYKDAL